MQVAPVKIYKKNETPIWTDKKPTIQLKIDEVGLIQHGTEGGQTSIAFRMEDNQGNAYDLELTENIFKGIHTILTNSPILNS